MLQRVIPLKSDEIVTDSGNFAPSDLQLPLLSSELFNSKEGVTMYFLIHCGHFSNKIALLHF